MRGRGREGGGVRKSEGRGGQVGELCNGGKCVCVWGGGGVRTSAFRGPLSDGEMNILRGGEWKVMKMRENN